VSYLSGVAPFTTVATGSQQSSAAGSTAVVFGFPAAAVVGDLTIGLLYSTVDPMAAVDAGEGWKLLAGAYDAANSYGLAMWGVINTRPGASGRAGITLATSGPWLSYTYTFRPVYPFRFDLGAAVNAQNPYMATADSRTQQFNSYEAAGPAHTIAQGLTLIAAGCTNNGTVIPTAAALSNHTERIDNGATSPPFNVSLQSRHVFGVGTAIDVYSVLSSTTYWSNTSARTKRVGLRAFVPVVGATMGNRNRYLASRRRGW
jgi:hypothetical protein